METSEKFALQPKLENLSRPQRWKSLLILAWPLIISNSFWNLQLTIDRVYLGHYSTEALGAAMAVMGLFWAPMALLQQTSAYVMTFVAQYLGAKRYEMIGPSFWHSLYIGIVGGLLFLLLIPAANFIFDFIGHAEGVKKLEIDYFVALCYSAMPTAFIAAASSYYTGLGNTKLIMWINCVGFLGNTVFAYIFIFGKFGFPEMGIAGAGYATALANWLAAFYGFYLVFQKSEARFALKAGWKYQKDLMKRFIKFGVPSGLQWSLEGLAFTVFLLFIGRMTNGSAGLAASSVVVTVMMLAILPALGVAQAVSVLVGQHLGEKNPRDAEISAWSGFQVAIMYIASIGITFLFFPNFYLSWFANNENPDLWSQVQTMVPYLLMFVALFTSFDSMNLVFSFALKGAGDTRFVSLVALIIPWPLMVLPTYLLKDQPGAVYWAWGATTVFAITQALIFWRRFVGGKWKQMSVIR